MIKAGLKNEMGIKPARVYVKTGRMFDKHNNKVNKAGFRRQDRRPSSVSS